MGALRRHARRRVLRTVVPLALELPKLALLAAVAVAAFVATGSVATHQQAQDMTDAQVLTARGERALRAGRVDDAVADLRRAVAKDRDTPATALTLARALAAAGQLEEAEQRLLTWRRRTPEDADTNLQLARLAARRGDRPAALTYFRSALYAPWPHPEQRMAVRLELSAFLLDHEQPALALPELIAAMADTTAGTPTRLEIGGMLLRAGDARRALQVFREVLAREPTTPRALIGAGEAAFELGQYPQALRYLRAAPDEPATIDRRSLAMLVISRDPLASGLGSAERRRRAAANLAHVSEQLRACAERREGSTAATAVRAAAEEVAMVARHRAPADRDLLEDGLEVIGRAEQTLAASCGDPSLLDRSLIIIAGVRAAAP